MEQRAFQVLLESIEHRLVVLDGKIEHGSELTQKKLDQMSERLTMMITKNECAECRAKFFAVADSKVSTHDFKLVSLVIGFGAGFLAFWRDLTKMVFGN